MALTFAARRGLAEYVRMRWGSAAAGARAAALAAADLAQVEGRVDGGGAGDDARDSDFGGGGAGDAHSVCSGESEVSDGEWDSESELEEADFRGGCVD